MLKAVKVIDASIRVSNSRNATETEESLAGKVVCCQNVMIHDSEENHRVGAFALFDAYGTA